MTVTDLLTTVSQITTISADLLIVLPFLSKSIRRKLFRAIIADIIYDIVNNQDGQISDMMKTLRALISFYDNFKGKGNVVVESKDD